MTTISTNFIDILLLKQQKVTEKTRIYSLRNVFGDYVTQTKKIAKLLNYRFSTLGKFQGPQHPLQTSGTGNPKQKILDSLCNGKRLLTQLGHWGEINRLNHQTFEHGLLKPQALSLFLI